MASETFTFSCPHCQTRLTVPLSLAGISGPCPSCRVSITAPKPGPGPQPKPKAGSAPEPLREEKLAELPALPLAMPEALPGGGAVATIPAVPEDSVRIDLPAKEGPRIRVEPRHLPERAPAPPISTRRSTEDRRAKTREEASSEPGRRGPRLVHLMFPLIFLTMAASVVGSLFYFFGPVAPGQQMKNATRPLVVPPSTKSRPVPPVPAESKLADAETTAPEPVPENPAASGTGNVRTASPAIAAYALLESFLQAKDAASRVDMVEPATNEQDLAATLLKGPLPEYTRIFSELPQHRPEEKMTDFPYRVSFAVKDAPSVDYAILVRQRGDQPPRVFLPAFLDLVGGRLAEFTREPNQLPPTLFHVYLEPIDGCYEKEEVPGAERKFTFKLLSSPFGKETARSYVANASRFRTLVEDPSYPIRWAMKRRATITLQWNHKEDPAKPFLELVDLNSPDWDP